MFIIVRNDCEVLAALDPFAPMAWVWIDYALSVATDHRYAVPFESRHGAEQCANLNGANVHTIGEWDDETEGSRSGDGRSVEDDRRHELGRSDAPGGRAGTGCACGRSERALQGRPEARRHSRREGGGPYLNLFRVVVNKFAN